MGMEDYGVGRSHFLPLFEQAKSDGKGVALVSLGDLGESKNCDHNPDSTSELFAGTTQCHELAADFLGSFDGVPYDVVGGNHDLEGLDEFETDAENLAVYLKAHGKDTAHFCREVADKTLLVGMGSTLFRDAEYTSHEVTIDPEQLAWFENLVQTHPAEDGWKVFVFTHAPPSWSGSTAASRRGSPVTSPWARTTRTASRSPPLTPRWGPTPTAAPASSPRPPSCAPGPPATAGSSPASSAGTRRASRSAPWTTRRTARSASTPPSPSRATPTRWACTRTRTRPTNTTSTSRCTSPTRGTASTPPTTGSSATTWTGTFPPLMSPWTPWAGGTSPAAAPSACSTGPSSSTPPPPSRPSASSSGPTSSWARRSGSSTPASTPTPAK